ncbi:unnamed protein product, partial [marine sediment metagenome]
MFPTQTEAPPSRISLLTAVMLVALALSTAGAWLVQETLGAAARRGAQIVADMARRGLSHYWGGRSDVRWYLVTDANGRPHGWRLTTRKADGDYYAGQDILRTAQGAHQSQWQLADDASEGRYASGTGLLRGQHPNVTIALTHNRVEVVTRFGASGLGPRPDNYIPEGAFPVVLLLTAAGGRPAKFKMIIDQVAVIGGQVHFITLVVTPQGADRVRASFTVLGKKPETTIYHLGADGGIEA